MDARKSRSPEPRAEDGYTMLELLTSAGIALVVFIATLTVLDIAGKTEPAVAERNSTIREAQVALDQITRELRQTYDVVAATPTSLTILTYANRTSCDSSATGTARQCQVVYSCTGGSFTRTAAEASGSGAGPARTLISGLASDAVFSYAPDALAPESVTATLTIGAEGAGTDEDAITLSDGVLLRNISGAVGG